MIDEAYEVIASTKTATLATINEDGAPYAVPVTYSYSEGRFVWVSAPDTVHSANISRDDRVSFCIVEAVEGKARAVYINTRISFIGETIFDEKWKTELTKYELELGTLDTKKSIPGRFYFQGENA